MTETINYPVVLLISADYYSACCRQASILLDKLEK